jgi:hypothetical protein
MPLWVVEGQDAQDDYTWEDAYFHNKEDAEAYAKYRTEREEFEYHERMWGRPATYSFRPSTCYSSAQDAIDDFEYKNGEPRSGAERLAEIEAREIAEGKRHEMVMINKKTYEEFKEWQKNNPPIQ